MPPVLARPRGTMGAMSSPALPATAALFDELDRVIRESSLEVHFQPIVDVGAPAIVGFEALTRAPANSALHSPLVLFDTAATAGRLVELERIVMRRIVTRFVELQLPGKLFINVTADTLLASESRIAIIAAVLQPLQLDAGRIVVELTETRPVFDPVALGTAVAALRSLGLLMALDDLGEGFSGLKRWVDLKPDFVKIDRHFIDGIASDPLKQQFVRSILEMASPTGTGVIAEGLEQEGDLRVLRGMGLHLCQGYLLARPSAMPRSSLRMDVQALLDSRDDGAGGRVVDADVAAVTAGQLAHDGPVATPMLTCAEAIEMFRRDPQLYSVPVVDEGGRPLGLLRSLLVLHRGAERFFLEIHGRASCRLLMDANPLVFDAGASLRTMSEAISNIDDRFMVDGFVITREGRYVGVGRTSELLRALSDLQVVTAQNANPLTRLPGNLAIDRQLARLLDDGARFLLVYWDISRFKAFNDLYGYAAGDEVIRMTAGLLLADAEQHGDFVGHIGGDDFVCVMASLQPAPRLERLCEAFDHGLRALLEPAHVAAGGYETPDRRGRPVFHAIPMLVGGALPVQPGRFASVRQLSAALAELRQQAKGLPHSGCFVERRQGPPPA